MTIEAVCEPKTKELWHYVSGKVTLERQKIVEEDEVSLVVNGEHVVTLLCTACALRELALGFLWNEGIISVLDDVESLKVLEGRVEITLRGEVARSPRGLVISSGFGGKALLCAQEKWRSFVPEKPIIAPDADRAGCADEVFSCMKVLSEQAVQYRATGGIHCSAFFVHDALVAAFEDIGRHNTFDKLAGYCLERGIDTTGFVLATTGRVSSEMLRKAARMGVSVLMTRSTPTNLAVSLAVAHNITVIGYIKNDEYVVFA